MAISYIHAGLLSRSQGRRATQFSAYISNTKIFDSVNGKTDDYTNKNDCVYSNVLLPTSAFNDSLNESNHPFKDRETLWNAIETIENSHNRRASAQLAVTFEIALPKELSLEHNKKLLDEFIKENYIDKYGLVAEVAIHDKGDGNPHGHVMLAMRQLDGIEFCKRKRRDILPPIRESQSKLIVNTDGLNKKYVTFQNRYFKENDIALVVDQDSIVPSKHVRRSRMDGTFFAKDIEYNNKVAKENLDKVSTNPEIIIATLSQRQVTFNQADIESLILKCTASDPDKYQKVLEAVMNSSQLIDLGYSSAGRVTYTIKANFNNDIDLMKMVNDLEGKYSFSINDKLINKVSYEKGLHEEQIGAVKHLIQSGNVSSLVGFAGTGKTYTMSALKEIYKRAGIEVYGTSISGKAVQGLQAEADIESQTIAKLLLSYKEGREDHLPPRKSVLVVDEAGMVGTEDMLMLVKMAKVRKLKLILAGDPKQLEAISRGSPFKAILEKVGFFEMKDIRRQVDILDQIATRNLGLGYTAKAIDHYYEKGSIHIQDQDKNAEDIINRYSALLDDGYYDEKKKQDVKYQVKDTIMLAYTRADVELLNSKAREVLLSRDLVSNDLNIRIDISSNSKVAEFKSRSFGIGDRIIFLRGKKLDCGRVENGLFGSIKSVAGDFVTVITDEDKPRELKIDTRVYNNFDHGYAVTVHKSQGASIQNTLGYVSSKNWDSHLTYVALSRHKRNMELYINDSAYGDIDSLKRGLSSRSKKEFNVFDFARKLESNRLASKIKRLFVAEQQETLDTNAKYKIVAELADVSREVNREYFKLLDESDSKELSDDNKAVLQSKYQYRNELAFKVSQDLDQYQDAIDLNVLDNNNILKWSENYVAEINFEKFVNSNNTLYKGKVADGLADTQRGRMLLSEHSKWQEYNTAVSSYKLNKLKSEQVVSNKDITLVESYLSNRVLAYKYYKKTQSEVYKDKDVELFKSTVFKKTVKQSELISNEHLRLSNKINTINDLLAYKIYQDLERYKPIIEAKYTGKMLDSVYDSIAKQARYHELREDVSKYQHAKGLTREQFAYKIATNGKEYARFIAEAYVDWKDINNDSRRIVLETFRNNLDEGVRPIFDSIQKYKDTQYEVAKIMSDLSKGVSDKKANILENVNDEQKKVLFKTIAQRNELAYELFNFGLSGKRDQELLNKLHPNFNLETAQKHEALHIERLEAQARVAQYGQLLGNKDKNLEQLKDIATTMTSRWNKHAFHVKYKKLNTNEIWSYTNQRQYDLENAKLTGIDKQIHRAIADYIIAKNNASVAWADIRLGKGNKEQAQELGNIRNLHAYDVSKLIGSNPTSAMYSMFNEKSLRLKDLIKSASEHELTIKLNDYTKLNSKSEEAIELAKNISVRYPQKGFIYYGLDRFDIDKKRFYTNVKIFDKNNLEFKQAKVNLDLYKEASDKSIKEWQGKLADQILSKQSNLKYIDKAGIDYNSININALEYRLANYKVGKEARIVEKFDFEKINSAFKQDINNYEHIFGSKIKETAKTISFGEFTVSKESSKWWDDNQNAYKDPTEAMLKVHGVRYNNENYAEYVGRVAGLDKSELRFKEIVDPVKNQLQNDLADFKEKVQKQKAVQDLWGNSKPLAGTIADRYLKKHRGIKDTSNLAMRYVAKGTDIMLSDGNIKPAHAPMLLVGGYNHKGEIVSAQRIYLDENTANKNTQMDNPKLSMGLVSGSGGLVQKGTSDRVYIVEGPETGASIALADKQASVYCSFGLGNLSKLDKLIKANNYKEVILAADNDGVGSNAEKLTKEASQGLQAKGIDLKVIVPKPIDGLAKTDWNDVLKGKGVQEIQKQIGVEAKEPELSQEHKKAKELLDRIVDRDRRIETLSKKAKFLDKAVIFRTLSKDLQDDVKLAAASVDLYTKEKEKLLEQFADTQDKMPESIKQTQEFKQVKEQSLSYQQEQQRIQDRQIDRSFDFY